MSSRRQAGFTLVEIMIVVLIIGILLAIAIPNFVQARETSRAKSCVANLYQINSAKTQCSMDNKLPPDSTATFSIDGTTATTLGPNGNYQLVVGSNTAFNYIRRVPLCTSGGSYTTGGVSSNPTCSVTGAAGSGYEYGARWYHGLN